jgi:hypothetical protein
MLPYRLSNIRTLEVRVMRRSYRWLVLIAAALALGAALFVSGCGGGDDDDSSSDDATVTATSSNEDSDGGSSDGSNGDDSNGGSDSGSTFDADDLEAIADDLVPPNATESGRVTTSEGVSMIWISEDDIDTLMEYYEDKFEELDLPIGASISAGGGHSWAFGDIEEFGGGVSLGPVPDGGTSVTIALGLN